MPSRTVAHPVTRRVALGATAWSVPALTRTAGWSASSQLVRGRDTGWYVNGTWSGGSASSDLVRSENQQWYRGLNTEPWNTEAPNLPNGTFLSFENNNSRTEDMTVTLSWTFQVTGNVRLSFDGMIMFGYGNQAQGRTQRQLVDIFVDGLSTPLTAPIAKLGAARVSPAGTIFPTSEMASEGGTTPQNYARLQPESAIADLGYTLHQPDGQITPGRFHAGYIAPDVIDNGAGTRTITVRAVLTMLALPSGTDTWVNDDVIVYPPVVLTSC